RGLEHRLVRVGEDETETDHEHDRQDDVPAQRGTVAQEFAVARVEDGEEFLHARSSLPVSSRKRSSSVRGRMRSWLSGTSRVISAFTAPLTSSVEISTLPRDACMRYGKSCSRSVAMLSGSSSTTSLK